LDDHHKKIAPTKLSYSIICGGGSNKYVIVKWSEFYTFIMASLLPLIV
jgi:hypothetical protein